MMAPVLYTVCKRHHLLFLFLPLCLHSHPETRVSVLRRCIIQGVINVKSYDEFCLSLRDRKSEKGSHVT